MYHKNKKKGEKGEYIEVFFPEPCNTFLISSYLLVYFNYTSAYLFVPLIYISNLSHVLFVILSDTHVIKINQSVYFNTNKCNPHVLTYICTYKTPLSITLLHKSKGYHKRPHTFNHEQNTDLNSSNEAILYLWVKLLW